MNLRDEVVGLARSLSYDIRRRIGRGTDDAYPEYDAYAQRPRRALIGGGIAVLAAAGVAGTYLALASGLGGWLLGTDPTGPNPAAPPQTPVVTSATPSATTTSRTAPSPTPTRAGQLPIPVTTVPPGPGRTATPSGRAISTPPVAPTPTPTPPRHSASPTPSPSATPSSNPSSTDPSAPPSPTPSDSGEASTESYASPGAVTAVPANMRTSSTFVSTGA
jgi:hypothetical protein